MTEIKKLAKELDKSEYGFDLTNEQKQYCKENEIVVVFGCSDDLMEFRGAIYDEFDCYEGGTCYLTKDGIFIEECDCKYAKQAKEKCKKIEAFWCKSEWCWEYKTDIPHETFEIWEDNEPYCKGIIFYKKELE